MARPIVLAWSGGKDSCLTLSLLLSDSRWEVAGLLTTVTTPYQRVTMHGVRSELLLAQGKSLGLSVDIVWIENGCSDEQYRAVMAEKLLSYKTMGINHVAFGDIFLEDVRHYRESSMAELGMEALFPLWGREGKKVLAEFLTLGFKAIVTCIDTRFIDRSFLGKTLDDGIHRDMGQDVDPCGERGEFHTFVYDGPLFSFPVEFELGEVVERDGGRFLFQDLIPKRDVS